MFQRRFALLGMTLLSLPLGLQASAGSDGSTAGMDSFSFLTQAEGVFQSQVVLAPDGTTLLVWAQRGADGIDLFAATRSGSDAFSDPVQVNREPINSYTGDEARPDVAIGQDGAVAIAWTAADMNMMLALGQDHGRSFSAPLRMNQDGGEAARTMPVVAFSSDGAVHGVWLDARGAPPRREEPANLYYARIEGDRVKEINLTADQEASVCGCCRPFIAIDARDGVDIAFRNTTAEGYRDIFLIEGNANGEFTQPRAASSPLWLIPGCPSVGPVFLDGLALWKDGSQSYWRLLSASSPSAEPEVVLEDTQGVLTLTFAPRRISGSDDLVLVGGAPQGFILKRAGEGWEVASEDVPEWASSGALIDGKLTLVGNAEGRLRVQQTHL
ncbi:MAG: hypothetical protein ACI8QZ_001389 [Chlamydiales bacterium]|jgi:hypothetical protein